MCDGCFEKRVECPHRSKECCIVLMKRPGCIKIDFGVDFAVIII